MIGDSCVDEFVYGSCDRLSPEAPVPVLKKIKSKTVAGMAGNVARNISAFTDHVDLITNTEIIRKVRYVDNASKQHIMRFDSEPDIIEPFHSSSVGGSYDVIVISDYDKGYCNSQSLSQFMNTLNQTVYVDTKKQDLSIFKNSIIKLNRKESLLVKRETLPKSSELITTLGPHGAMYNDTLFPARPAEVFDVSGAGDTFLATFALFHTITDSVAESIAFSNKCARMVVQKQGTSPIERGDLNG